jgi:hypothetical protein
MSIYWIIKYAYVPKYQVSDGYQYFQLLINTQNKSRADRLLKYYQDLRREYENKRL